MTYRIEIQADTLSELSGKVLALAAQLNTTPTINPVMPELRAEAPAVDVGNGASNAEAPSPTSSSAPVTPIAESAPPPSEPALDFDKDVAPAVLAVVAAKGKPAVQDILSEYGVERASQVDEALWPELVATLRAAI